MPEKKAVRPHKAGDFSISRNGMDKINAVEGIKRNAASRRMFAEFDKQGMPSEQRRRAMIAMHARKA